MKYLLLIALLCLSANALSANFPITKKVTVTKIEVWPSNAGQGKYGAWVSESLSEAECPHTNMFQIKQGPAEDAAYSTLLAGVLAGKQIEIYITECGYTPIADRIRLIP